MDKRRSYARLAGRGAVLFGVAGLLFQWQASTDDSYDTSQVVFVFAVAAVCAVVWFVLWIGTLNDQVGGELERLADLHRRGDLTAEEYAAAKRRLLAADVPPDLQQ
jgi:hypothetical protein